jgi:hypothetical protein
VGILGIVFLCLEQPSCRQSITMQQILSLSPSSSTLCLVLPRFASNQNFESHHQVWNEAKVKLEKSGLEYPNLPYIIDTDGTGLTRLPEEASQEPFWSFATGASRLVV